MSPLLEKISTESGAGETYLFDPDDSIREQLKPDVLVDATMAKRNTGTKITDAPLVIGLGPGFCVGSDVHIVVETNHSDNLGRVIRDGEAEPNTGIPIAIGGLAKERVIGAPKAGIFTSSQELLITTWSPIHLRRELDQYLWKDGQPHISVKQLWEYLGLTFDGIPTGVYYDESSVVARPEVAVKSMKKAETEAEVAGQEGAQIETVEVGGKIEGEVTVSAPKRFYGAIYWDATV